MLNRDFKEFVESLASSDVRFLIVGGYALAAHGHPRYTKDLDVWIAIDGENRQRVVDALEAFGFGSLGLSEADFAEPGFVIQLGQPPARIDLLTSLTGVDFETCWAKRHTVDVRGLDVPFIDLEDLKTNKLALGRHQDLADLEALGGD